MSLTFCSFIFIALPFPFSLFCHSQSLFFLSLSSPFLLFAFTLFPKMNTIVCVHNVTNIYKFSIGQLIDTFLPATTRFLLLTIKAEQCSLSNLSDEDILLCACKILIRTLVVYTMCLRIYELHMRHIHHPPSNIQHSTHIFYVFNRTEEKKEKHQNQVNLCYHHRAFTHFLLSTHVPWNDFISVC